MRIAVLGAGLSGLAVAWFFLSSQVSRSFEVTLFDHIGIGGGASGVAAGLLHPFAGAHSKLNFKGFESFQSTKNLLQIASQELGQPVFDQRGIIRPALSNEQFEDFHQCALKYPEEVKWLTEEQIHRLYPELAKAPGIWMPNALVVDCPLYLKGLWQACQKKGARFKKEEVRSLSQLADYDLIICALGSGIKTLPELSHVKITFNKGQLLRIAWPKEIPPLPFVVNSHGYLLRESATTCFAGTTYEKQFISSEPDREKAIQEIMPKMIEMIPILAEAKILDCFAGIRVVGPGHLPLTKQINEKTWCITGMGSKGLLYHARIAQEFVEKII